MEKMAVDKKNKGGKKAVVLLSSLGKVAKEEPVLVEDDVIERVLSEYLSVVPPGKGVCVLRCAHPIQASTVGRELVFGSACLRRGKEKRQNCRKDTKRLRRRTPSRARTHTRAARPPARTHAHTRTHAHAHT